MGTVKTIVIADDEAGCRQEFTSRPGLFKVIEVPNANDLVEELKKCFVLGCKPDLVLLDIWRPGDPIPPDQADREQRAKKSLQDLTAQLEITRHAVEEAWIPRGFHILEELRREWPDPNDLPIAMYSKRGYFLAKPDQLELIENLRAHWILKNDENEYFEYVQDRIDRLVNIYRQNRTIKKKLTKMRIFSIIGFFVSLTSLIFLFGSHFLGAGSIPETILTCALSAIITYAIDRLLLR